MKALLFIVLAHFVLSEDLHNGYMEDGLADKNERLRQTNIALRKALNAMREDESAIAEFESDFYDEFELAESDETDYPEFEVGGRRKRGGRRRRRKQKADEAIRASHTCAAAQKICAGVSFPASTTSQTVPPASNCYGHVTSQPNPAWFVFEIAANAPKTVQLTISAQEDIDHVLWGPFDSEEDAYSSCGSLQCAGQSKGIIDDDFSGHTVTKVDVSIPNAHAGNVYILLVTNYGGGAVDIHIDLAENSAGAISCAGVAGVQACSAHNECSGETPFCNAGHCASCDECQHCKDGVDGTCGSCGKGFPTDGKSCGGSKPASNAHEYTRLEGKHCGGSSISRWADGSNARYGAMSGIESCKAECDKHAECAGFVQRDSDNKCGFWKKGPLSPQSAGGHHCYEKGAKEGSAECDFMQEGDGFTQTCDIADSEWHTSIDHSADGCTAEIKTEGKTCEDFCQSVGKTCLYGQDNTHGCTLDKNHGRKSTRNNGCNQGWYNQVCTCGTEAPEKPKGNVINDNDQGVGTWGGYCTCPDGQVYGVADLNNYCESLACYGGTSSGCNRHDSKEWSHKSVTCGSTVNQYDESAIAEFDDEDLEFDDESESEVGPPPPPRPPRRYRRYHQSDESAIAEFDDDDLEFDDESEAEWN